MVTIKEISDIKLTFMRQYQIDLDQLHFFCYISCISNQPEGSYHMTTSQRQGLVLIAVMVGLMTLPMIS